LSYGPTEVDIWLASPKRRLLLRARRRANLNYSNTPKAVTTCSTSAKSRRETRLRVGASFSAIGLDGNRALTTIALDVDGASLGVGAQHQHALQFRRLCQLENRGWRIRHPNLDRVPIDEQQVSINRRQNCISVGRNGDSLPQPCAARKSFHGKADRRYGNRTPNLIPNSLVQLFGSRAENCSTAVTPLTVNVTLAGLIVESSTPQ